MLYYVSAADIPGEMAHTIQQMRMCAAFANQGVDVSFIHPDRNGPVDWGSVADYYGLKTEFEIKTVSTLEGTMDSIPYSGLLSTSVSIAGALLRRILRGEINSSDTIYSRDYYSTFVFNELLRLVPDERRPVLAYEHHDIISAHLKERFFTSIDAVVPITHALEEYDIETYGISTDDCLVAPDGVDIEPYERQTRSGARDKLGLPEDERIVMYTGHLHSGKGVETLVEAAAEITAQVYVVGGYEDDIERVRSERNVPNNVVFTGFVQPSEISIYQSAADILVAPYTTESRDFISPLKLFEYMATGNPVVATSRQILQEVLTHGENALLAEPNYPKDLAQYINELLTDEERATAIADRARADVQAYTWDERAKSILEFLRASN